MLHRSAPPDSTVAVLTFFVYLLFIPATLCCSTHFIVEMLMCCLGFVVILLKMLDHAGRVVGPNGVLDHHAMRCPVLLDLLSVVRALATTALPMVLATFGGGAFAFDELLVSTATDCSVSQLPLLAAQGYRKFACTDGFIGVHLQVDVTAWQDVGVDPGVGYVAPIFLSRQAHRNGQAPVAWAVKAGSEVHEPWCDGTCGFFAVPLQQHFSVFAAPRHFGEAWGFNLTHFSVDEMQRAVDTFRADRDWPVLGAGPSQETFVVAETVGELFRSGYQCMWVMITLFGVGFLDVLHKLADTRARVDGEEVAPKYVGMVTDQSGYQHGGLQDGSLWQQAAEFWDDPYKTKSVGHWRAQGAEARFS